MDPDRDNPAATVIDDDGTASTWIRPTPAPMPAVNVPIAARSIPGVTVAHLDGEDLATHLANHGPLSADQALRLAVLLSETLVQLRAHGMTFRTLRANQLFLSGGLAAFAPKLVGEGNTDFPLVRLEDSPGNTDIAAVGLLLATAVAGRPVLDAQDLAVAAELPPWLQTVLARCLPGSEAFREPSELASALESLLQSRTPPPIRLTRLSRPEMEGDVVGNYQLVRKLGEGSMGHVFLARHATLGRTVALKMLRPEHARDEALVQRFFHEAKAVNQINHEHIVEIRDFVQDTGPGGSGRVYCVMELLEGQSVGEVLRAGPVRIARAVRIVRQVCAALSAAHQVGVIHRDVKPDNLFLTERNGDPDYVKVLDFGVAKLGGPLGDTPTSGTMAGTVLGTPMYMAPEQAAGSPVDGRTDLYALATVLYELLAGHPPFRAPTVGQMVVQVITQPPPPLPARTPGGERIPITLRNLVMRCLEKDPARRPRTMVELSALLLPYELGVGERRPLWLYGAVAAGVLAVGGCAAWIAERSAPSEPDLLAVPRAATARAAASGEAERTARARTHDDSRPVVKAAEPVAQQVAQQVAEAAPVTPLVTPTATKVRAKTRPAKALTVREPQRSEPARPKAIDPFAL